MAFNLVISKKFLEGCMSSNLNWCTIHSQMLRCAMIGNKVFEGITNTFIIRFWNVANNVKT